MRTRFCALAVLVLSFACMAAAQNLEPAVTATGSVSANDAGNPFMGSVVQGDVTAATLQLSLQEAIRLGLQRNLGAVLSSEGERAARGQRLTALSELLPDIHATVAESSQQVNLAAFGLPAFPGVPPVIGPFQLFDARGMLTQKILDFQSLNDSRASVQNLKAAEFSYKDARELVVLVVTSLYMQAVSGNSRIDAGRAQVELSQALYGQAVDRKNAGLAPAIDVLRAQVELQSQRQRLIFFENEHEKQLLQLKRAAGIPGEQAIALSDELPYSALENISYEQAVSQALESRMDYRSLSSRLRAAEFRSKAARSGNLPSLSFHGDYGTLGRAPTNSHGTFTAAVSLDIPVYTGGRVKGETLAADAALAQQRAQLDDLKSRIGYEIRSSLLDLHAAAEQVQVNQNAIELARSQETQARDRFAAGVTDNLEVVQAQEALAAANQNYITSLYSYNLSKASLARAIGGIEQNIGNWLLGAKP